MKKFANAEIEVVKFDNAVIATSGCTDITKAENYDDEYENYNRSMQKDFGQSFEQYLSAFKLIYDPELNDITKANT